MKKIIITFAVIVYYLNCNLYASEKTPQKLMAGLILVAAGSMVSYTGFKLADISRPEMSAQSFTWDKVSSGTNWDASAQGTIKNTGNLPLHNIKLTVIYKDSLGAELGQQTISPDNKSILLMPGDTDTFSSSVSALPEEPFFISTRFKADFFQEFESSNIATGYAGLAVIAAGAFFITDYFLDITDFFEKNDMKVQLSCNTGGLSLLAMRLF